MLCIHLNWPNTCTAYQQKSWYINNGCDFQLFQSLWFFKEQTFVKCMQKFLSTFKCSHVAGTSKTAKSYSWHMRMLFEKRRANQSSYALRTGSWVEVIARTDRCTQRSAQTRRCRRVSLKSNFSKAAILTYCQSLCSTLSYTEEKA